MNRSWTVRICRPGLGLLAALLTGVPVYAVVPPSEPPPAVQQVEDLLAAISQGGGIAAITPGELQSLRVRPELSKTEAETLRLRLRKGYQLLPLGLLKSGGRNFTLWKIAFADGGDDLVVALQIR